MVEKAINAKQSIFRSLESSIHIQASQLMSNKVAGSLFSGGGIGDVGIEWGNTIPVLAASEIIPSRAALIRKNFPQTKVFEGDIRKTKWDYINFFHTKLGANPPWLITL